MEILKDQHKIGPDNSFKGKKEAIQNANSTYKLEIIPSYRGFICLFVCFKFRNSKLGFVYANVL